MIEQRRQGAMIDIISTAGHQGEPENIAYCTGKSGLLNFTRSAGLELVEHGIRVNSITPMRPILQNRTSARRGGVAPCAPIRHNSSACSSHFECAYRC